MLRSELPRESDLAPPNAAGKQEEVPWRLKHQSEKEQSHIQPDTGFGHVGKTSVSIQSSAFSNVLFLWEDWKETWK